MRAAIAAEPGMTLVGEARSGAACLDDIQEVQPDLVLLDLSMADDDRDGLWALPRIKASVPGCAVIVLSAFSEEWMGDRARAAGASDYIQKGTPLSDIMSAVRRIAATRGD
jgi:DNA-binding NarL/FixJ family response regulator